MLSVQCFSKDAYVVFLEYLVYLILVLISPCSVVTKEMRVDLVQLDVSCIGASIVEPCVHDL